MTALPPTLIRFESELERAIRLRLASGRPRSWSRVVRLAAAAGAAAAIALGVLSTVPGEAAHARIFPHG